MNILELSEQEILRRQSLDELRQQGIDPYPAAEYPTNAFSTEIVSSFSDDAEPVEIELDCDVKPDYTVDLLTGNATAENSLEFPDNVHDISVRSTGASRSFVYQAPALSVNILKLAKA